jgi:hypothetical protein
MLKIIVPIRQTFNRSCDTMMANHKEGEEVSTRQRPSFCLFTSFLNECISGVVKRLIILKH